MNKPLLLLAAAALAGCSHAPPTQFHTLVPDAPAQASPDAGLAFRIDRPVTVPAQVDRPQMVLRRPDGGIQVMEQQRWVAPVADEWPAVVADRVAQRAGAFDATRSASPAGAAFRVQLALQRFEMSTSGDATQQVQWSIVPPGATTPAAACRVLVSVKVSPEPEPLAAAQRALTLQVADGIAAALRSLHQGGSARCP